MAASSATSGTRIDYAATLDQRSKILILIGVLLSLFLSALDQTIVSTALPRIVADLQGIELLGWVTTSYLLASTAMVPIYGKLSDLYGRKIILIFGIIVFLLGSVLCGLSASMLQLVIFRGIQGFGAAALTSVAFAIPADLFAPAERARYMGVFGASFGLASVIGPFAGGLLTDTFSWHWVFFVNLPIGIIALVFIMLKLPRLHSGLRSPIDYFGAITLIIGVVPFLLALTLDKTQYPWNSGLILGLLATTVVGISLFIFAERRAASPILPLHLFKNRTYTLVNIIGVTVGATMFAAIIFLSLYLVNVLGVSATEAGTTLIPMTLSLVLASIISSQIVQRTGRYKLVIMAGLVITTLALFWLSTLTTETSIWMVRLRMVALGFGLGPAMPLLNLAMQNAVAREDMGTATASRQFFQQIGQVLGSAIFGALLTATLTSTLTTNLEPIRAQLPAEMAAQLDPNSLRNGSAGASEGVASESADPAAAIEQGITAQFDAQRTLLTQALRDADPAAIAALEANPQTPAQLKELLPNVAALPAEAREQTLTGALQALDQAQAQAIEQGQALGAQISQAIKQGFTDSITMIYRYAIFLGLIALAVAFFIPEIPLKRHNSENPPAMVFE